MRTKFTATLTALSATLALVASPASAQDVDTGDDDGDEFGQVRTAAARARTAAQDLEDGDADPEFEAGQERATEALQAAVYRFSIEGASGSGVAAEILTKLLEGESPSEIGAAHGAEMAKAAAYRRTERAEAGHGRPEHAGAAEDARRPVGAGRS